MAEYADIFAQPITELQLNQLQVEWVAHGSIKPNKYNPNRMTPADRSLLRQSLLEDGWTQPIVVTPDNTIIDGEQRWVTAQLTTTPADIRNVLSRLDDRQASGAEVSQSVRHRLEEALHRLEQAVQAGVTPSIAAITGGMVPVTHLDLGDNAHLMISTIRHNRARGDHKLDSMADITRDLMALGLDLDDLESRLGMSNDEVDRFLDMAGAAEQMLRQQAAGFSQSWDIMPVAGITDDPEFLYELQRSEEATAAVHASPEAVLAQEAEIEVKIAAALAAEKERGVTPTTASQDRIEAAVRASVPALTGREALKLAKVVFYVTMEEKRLIEAQFKTDLATAVVALARQRAEQA